MKKINSLLFLPLLMLFACQNQEEGQEMIQGENNYFSVVPRVSSLGNMAQNNAASYLIDNDERTAWIADGGVGEFLILKFEKDKVKSLKIKDDSQSIKTFQVVENGIPQEGLYALEDKILLHNGVNQVIIRITEMKNDESVARIQDISFWDSDDQELIPTVPQYAAVTCTSPSVESPSFFNRPDRIIDTDEGTIFYYDENEKPLSFDIKCYSDIRFDKVKFNLAEGSALKEVTVSTSNRTATSQVKNNQLSLDKPMEGNSFRIDIDDWTTDGRFGIKEIEFSLGERVVLFHSTHKTMIEKKNLTSKKSYPFLGKQLQSNDIVDGYEKDYQLHLLKDGTFHFYYQEKQPSGLIFSRLSQGDWAFNPDNEKELHLRGYSIYDNDPDERAETYEQNLLIENNKIIGSSPYIGKYEF